ncbi:MAG: FHA domain-containing protein [Planctomycetota bacterium]
MKIRLFPPGQKPIEHDVASNPAGIGRDPSCDVVVPHPFVSKRHVMIHAGVVVEDLDSFNGTLVDGEPVERPALAPGGGFSVAGRMDVQVVVTAADSARPEVDPELEALRTRTAVLERELATAATERDELAERVEELEARLRGGAAAPPPEEDDEPARDDGTMPTIVHSAAPETLVSARPADPLHTVVETRTPVDAGPPAEILAEVPVGGALGAFAEEGPAGLEPSKEDRVDEAVLRAMLRTTLWLERFVTGIDGGPGAGAAQVDGTHTVLAEFEGALRALIGTLVEDPVTLEHRERLGEYLAGLERRLEAAFGAPRAAAADLVREVATELSEDALAADPPMPLLARVPGAREAELWRRAVARLGALTDEHLRSRLDALVRARPAAVQRRSEEDRTKK